MFDVVQGSVGFELEILFGEQKITHPLKPIAHCY
jgi:hypothetical protein